MAWIALGNLVLYIPMLAVFYKYGFIDDKWLSSLSGLLVVVITALTGILGAYVGFATLDDIKRGNDV